MRISSVVHIGTFLSILFSASIPGCGDSDQESNGTTTPNNPNGTYSPYGDGGVPSTGPKLFVDRNHDGINDLCADVYVQASRSKPIVTFVVDGSSSMDRNFQNIRDSRWEVMVSTLMDQNSGVVYGLQNLVLFGMVLFSGPSNQCPDLRIVDPALNNYDAIDSVISGYTPDMNPPKYTPTALALEAAYGLEPEIGPDLGSDLGPYFVVLCTDGNPNSCEAASSTGGGIFGGGIGGDPPPEFDGPVQAVTDGYQQGTKTFVISLASGQDDYQQHLDQLAEIGNPGTPSFSPSTQDELVALMEQIVGGALGCQVTLNGKVTVGKECTGLVELNSTPLECNDLNGWRLVDERHIELTGSACDSFMDNPNSLLNASFPCDVFDLELVI